MFDIVVVVHVYIVHFVTGSEDVHLTRTHKDAVPIFAFKVALPLDRTVILSCLCIELNADPYARGERCLADKEHLSIAQIGDADARMQVNGLRSRHDCCAHASSERTAAIARIRRGSTPCDGATAGQRLQNAPKVRSVRNLRKCWSATNVRPHPLHAYCIRRIKKGVLRYSQCSRRPCHTNDKVYSSLLHRKKRAYERAIRVYPMMSLFSSSLKSYWGTSRLRGAGPFRARPEMS